MLQLIGPVSFQGLFKCTSSRGSGKDTVLSCIAEGGWWGEGPLLKRENRRYSAVALLPTRIILIPLETFHQLRDSSIAFNHYLQDLMNKRMSSFIELLEADRLLTPELRVAKCLESLCASSSRLDLVTLAIF